MMQLNTNGEMVGYFNESWSEAEICKSGLDPKELFSEADYSCPTDHDSKACFTVRIEVINQFQLYKNPVKSCTNHFSFMIIGSIGLL